ncbi:MAG: formyltetrahydrofolate deformylase [Saprospiraceae bacterium]|nr:formyltetrahydrofolate deformylase [Saprospiraceae bacterium]
MENKFILRVDCPDRVGLVHDITGILSERGANIISNDEFVDPDNKHFYMRTVFVHENGNGEINDSLREILGPEAQIRVVPPGKKRAVILATKEYHCLGDLLMRNRFDELNMDVLCVISNHEILKSLTESFEVPFHHVSHEGVSRDGHEQMIKAIIDSYNPDILVLAKYMRILNKSFVGAFPLSIVNIHHSFLPAFIGASPYRQAYQRGVKIIGATAHYVTEDLDEGPIIVQDVIPVSHQMDLKEMINAGRDVEKVVLARALKLICEDRVFVYGNKTVIF